MTIRQLAGISRSTLTSPPRLTPFLPPPLLLGLKRFRVQSHFISLGLLITINSVPWRSQNRDQPTCFCPRCRPTILTPCMRSTHSVSFSHGFRLLLFFFSFLQIMGAPHRSMVTYCSTRQAHGTPCPLGMLPTCCVVPHGCKFRVSQLPWQLRKVVVPRRGSHATY